MSVTIDTQPVVPHYQPRHGRMVLLMTFRTALRRSELRLREPCRLHVIADSAVALATGGIAHVHEELLMAAPTMLAGGELVGRSEWARAPHLVTRQQGYCVSARALAQE